MHYSHQHINTHHSKTHLYDLIYKELDLHPSSKMRQCQTTHQLSPFSPPNPNLRWMSKSDALSTMFKRITSRKTSCSSKLQNLKFFSSKCGRFLLKFRIVPIMYIGRSMKHVETTFLAKMLIQPRTCCYNVSNHFVTCQTIF